VRIGGAEIRPAERQLRASEIEKDLFGPKRVDSLVPDRGVLGLRAAVLARKSTMRKKGGLAGPEKKKAAVAHKKQRPPG
jgi:hypothetical protein